MTKTNIRPEEIDESFVPRPKPSVASVELDGERVLYDTETWRLHQLDPVGSLIWACFDGATAIAEMASDLADAFGTDIRRVGADVLQLVRSLAAEDLLMGVAGAEAPEPTEPAAPDTDRDDDAPSFLVDPPGG